MDLRDCFQVLGTCVELDALVSIPYEGDMAILRKKVKSRAPVGKLVLIQIIMANLPPPNHDANLSEDEPVQPEPAPIILYHIPAQPEGYVNDEADPEEEPEEEEEPIPEQAPAAPDGFAPQWIGGHDPNNNNGWIEEDNENEVEAEEEDEEKIEVKGDEEIEAEDNDGENDDAKIYYPYEEADPLNRPPPSPEIAEREIMNAPVTRSTLQPIPPI
ncbi:hypothetical protein Tco_1303372 [Tanacetum coccineum]